MGDLQFSRNMNFGAQMNTSFVPNNSLLKNQSSINQKNSYTSSVNNDLSQSINTAAKKNDVIESDPLAASMIASLSNVTPFVTPFFHNYPSQPRNVGGQFLTKIKHFLIESLL